jgi:hypothetical protein
MRICVLSVCTYLQVPTFVLCFTTVMHNCNNYSGLEHPNDKEQIKPCVYMVQLAVSLSHQAQHVFYFRAAPDDIKQHILSHLM